MSCVLCMKIDGFGVVTLSLEVACLDDDFAITDGSHIEESRSETECQVRTAGSTAQVESALMLDDVSRVALCHEAEGNLIHLWNLLFIDKAYCLPVYYLLERLEAYKRTFFHIGRSSIVVVEVTKVVVDGGSLAPLVCLVVLLTIELESVPLARIDGIGKSHEITNSTCNGFDISINLSLCISASLEVGSCFLQGRSQCADVAIGAPEARIVADGNQIDDVLVCFNSSSKSGRVNKESLESIESILQSIVVFHLHFVQVYLLCSIERSLDSSCDIAHLTPLRVAIVGKSIELEGREVTIATPCRCPVNVETEVLIAFSIVKTIGIDGQAC